MTNFSGIGRQGLWSWLTPERAVLVMPVLAGLGLSMALLSVGITPLTMRVREQSEVVEQLTTKAEFVPVLRQQLAVLKREQEERDQQLDRLLDLVAGTSELQTFLAELNDMGRSTTSPSPPQSLGLWNAFKRQHRFRRHVRWLHRQPVVVTLERWSVVIHCSIVVWRNVQLLSR